MKTQAAITAVFDDPSDAGRAIEQLSAAGVDQSKVSVLMAEEVHRRLKERAEHAPIEHPASSDTKRAATAGAVLGGTLAALIGVAVSLTGFGLIAVGPVVAALGAGGVGATAGGMLGALVGMGIHDDVAKVYERELLGGAMLIGVETTHEQADGIEQLLVRAGGRDLERVERV